MSRTITSALVLTLALAPVACSNSQEKARAKLATMRVAYSDESFVDRAKAGDLLAVEKFLVGRHERQCRRKDGKTALIAAAEEGRLPMVERLLAGRRRHQREGQEIPGVGTPVRLGAHALGHRQAPPREGGDPRVQETKQGMTPLLSATMKSDRTIVQMLLDHGAPLNDRDKEGRSALIWASGTGNIEIARMLLQHGADLKPREKQHGADALLVAAARGRTPLVKLLLDKGADAASLDSDGKNGLMWAALNGHTETVSLFLKVGVDPSVRDSGGKTAAVLAKEAEPHERRGTAEGSPPLLTTRSSASAPRPVFVARPARGQYHA